MARNFIFKASAEEQEVIMNMYVNAVSGRLREVQSPSEQFSSRWIWELIQNASDSIVSDETRKDVEVEIVIEPKCVTFRHNGSPFTRRCLLALLYKYSQGKRNTLSTGRFGTGFMTTHCLSTIIGIKSDIFDEGALRGFQLTMYRDGFDEEELMEGLRKTNESVKEVPVSGWTEFKYHLKSKVNMKSRDLGVQSFQSHIVETFLFCHRLRLATMRTPKEVIKVYRGKYTQCDGYAIQEVVKEVNNRKEVRSFFLLERKWGMKEHQTIDLAVDITGNKLMDHQDRACRSDDGGHDQCPEAMVGAGRSVECPPSVHASGYCQQHFPSIAIFLACCDILPDEILHQLILRCEMVIEALAGKA